MARQLGLRVMKSLRQLLWGLLLIAVAVDITMLLYGVAGSLEYLPNQEQEAKAREVAISVLFLSLAVTGMLATALYWLRKKCPAASSEQG